MSRNTVLQCHAYCRYPFDIPTEAFPFVRFKQALAAVQASNSM